MKHSQAADALYYKICSITINIDIVRKNRRKKKSKKNLGYYPDRKYCNYLCYVDANH